MMEYNQKKIRFWAVAIICNILFIWGNSLLPGSVSGAISGAVKHFIFNILLGKGGANEGGHGLLRKLGHFTEFACLGILMCRLLYWMKKPQLLALAGAFLVACCDETIQRFVPDRGPSFKDVMIDTSGALTGMILLFVGYACIKRKKQATEEK